MERVGKLAYSVFTLDPSKNLEFDGLVEFGCHYFIKDIIMCLNMVQHILMMGRIK